MRRKEYRSGFIVRTALDKFDLVPRTLRDIDGFSVVDANDTDFTGLGDNRVVKWQGDLATGKMIKGPLLVSDIGDDTTPGSTDKVPDEFAVKQFLKLYMSGFDLQESVLHKGFNSPYEAGGGPFTHNEGYMIGGSPVDEWAGHPYALAYWDEGLYPAEGWRFVDIDTGLIVEVEDENAGLGIFYYWTGGDTSQDRWKAIPYLQDIIKLGAIDPTETIKGATHEAIYNFTKEEAVKAAIIFG